MVNTNRSLTINGTANQVISSAGAQSLAANRTWTLSLPQNIHTAATPTFGQLTLNAAGSTTISQLTLSGTTNNWIGFNTNGVAAPAFTTRSAGTKIVLYPGIGAAAVDYALGIEGSTLWNSVPTTSQQFRWYGGTTQAMQLSGGGNLTLAGNLVAAQVDTGQGLTEVHLMNQNIRTTDSPTFGGLTINGTTTTPRIAIQRVSNVGNGISWYNSATYTSWSDYMSPAGQTSTGPTSNITAPSGTLVTSWALRRFIENGAGYGWTFESGTFSQVTPTVVAEIRSSDGAARFGGGLTLSAATTTLSFSSATGAKTISTGGSTDLALSPGGNVRVKTAGLTGGGALQVGGDVRASGEVFAFSSSDKQLKDNITLITNPIEKIMKIGGYTFDWNDKQTFNSGKDYGVIAQEIEKIMPELVNVNHNGFKAVRYEKITPLLIEAIKEQNSMIKNQKERIDKLEEVIQQILNK
jgi:hypothetical protein